VRNLIKEVKPEVVVLEMCQDRYDHWFYDAIAHPNYDKTLIDLHRVLDQGRGEGILAYKGIDASKTASHLEFLVGLDQCSYRNMPAPCQTVFGDRSIKITNKRYKSKLKMLEVYREALEQAPSASPATSGGSTIFDIESSAKDDD